jgi:large subunit ribosomal protein L30
MAKMKITLVKSTIHCPAVQKRTVKALGIKRIRHTVEVEGTPQILGMVHKVRHLLKIEEN